jgi:hypothetical protein
MKHILLIFLCLTWPALAVADPATGNDPPRRFIDLGGKTVNALGSLKPLTGVRAGMQLANKVNVGIAGFVLAQQQVSTRNGGYEIVTSYSFTGVYAEYVYRLSDNLELLPGLLAGVGMGKYETDDGNTLGHTKLSYFGLEPSLSLSLRVYHNMWLNLGGSYFSGAQDVGLRSGAALNIFARYKW